MTKIDITGQKFNMLTAIKPLRNDKYNKVIWQFKCDCGNTYEAVGSNVKCGEIKNCGCIHGNKQYSNFDYDNPSHKRAYRIWNDMKRRCFCTNRKDYPRYGGRGITMCDNWLNFQNFWDWSLTNGYDDNLSIDRINPNGNYEPSNCRWSNAKEQANNKRNNHYITFRGVTKSMADWSNELDISYTCLRARLRRGWSVERALGGDAK